MIYSPSIAWEVAEHYSATLVGEGTTPFFISNEKFKQPPRKSLLFVNSFVNQRIELLQKIKTISFMKLTVVTVTQFTLVNLNGL